MDPDYKKHQHEWLGASFGCPEAVANIRRIVGFVEYFCSVFFLTVLSSVPNDANLKCESKQCSAVFL